MVGSGLDRAEDGMAVSMGDSESLTGCLDAIEVVISDRRTSRALVSDTHILRHNRVGECQRGNSHPWGGKEQLNQPPTMS